MYPYELNGWQLYQDHPAGQCFSAAGRISCSTRALIYPSLGYHIHAHTHAHARIHTHTLEENLSVHLSPAGWFFWVFVFFLADSVLFSCAVVNYVHFSPSLMHLILNQFLF